MKILRVGLYHTEIRLLGMSEDFIFRKLDGNIRTCGYVAFDDPIKCAYYGKNKKEARKLYEKENKCLKKQNSARCTMI